MWKEKIKDLRELQQAKSYILITDRISSLSGDLTGISNFMRLHVLYSLRQNLDAVIKKYEKEGENGRQHRRGSEGKER